MKIFLAVIFAVLVCGASDALAAGDLITADKTVVVQFILFLVALYLLNILFFKPLIEIAERRESATSGSGKEAEELTKKSELITAEYNKALKEAREQALAERAEITRSAVAEAESIVSSAREEAGSIVRRRTEELELLVEKAKEEMDAEIEEIASMITRAAGGETRGV